LNNTSWYLREKLKEKDFDKDEIIQIDLSEISDIQKLETFKKNLEEFNASKKTITTVSVWIENVKDPNNAVVTSLQGLVKMLNQATKSSKLGWIMKTNPDGFLVPYAVSEAKYQSRTREESAYVYLSITNIFPSYDRYSDDDSVSLKEKTESIYFYKSDINEYEEDIDLFSDENDDDDDESESKKIKKDKKEDKYRLTTILAKKNISLITKSDISIYQEQLKETKRIMKNTGEVYTCEGLGFVIQDNKNRYESWKNINEEDKTSKLCIDTVSQKKSTSSVSNKRTNQTYDVPLAPYLVTYNLSSYNYCVVHVSALKKYEYDKNLINKLVLSEKKKKILSSLISEKNTFSDIITGKSGGIIILCYGLSGLGKTLTAEIYSELIGKPLYSIQSSQLGINVDEIEKNLNKILYRAISS
jgi:hypothetical protein